MLKSKAALFLSLGLAFLAGAGLTTLLSLTAGYYLVQHEKKRVRRGWNLVPVVVAAEDIPEGKRISFEMLAQNPIPEKFVTASVVKPDSASFIVGQRTLVPMQAGDPLLWSMFETSKAPTRPSVDE